MLHVEPTSVGLSTVVEPLAGRLWAIVLAGGEGMRLRPLVRRIHGDDRPKQYAALMGSRSLLRQTLDRITRRVARDRVVIVTARSHARYIADETTALSGAWVLPQPMDRGTAAGILWPAHWIRERDPDATIVVFPSDHLVCEEDAFMAHVAATADLVDRDPRWIVLLGAQAPGPEADLGWVEPGEVVAWAGMQPIRRVRRFWEKPDVDTTRACFVGGCLLNTFIFVGRVATLIELGREILPALHDRLARIGPFAGTADESWALQQAYSLAPKADFSRTILASCPHPLAVSMLPPLLWSDLGTPERVRRAFEQLGVAGPWLPGDLAE